MLGLFWGTDGSGINWIKRESSIAWSMSPAYSERGVADAYS
jgi:hypothetical protein